MIPSLKIRAFESSGMGYFELMENSTTTFCERAGSYEMSLIDPTLKPLIRMEAEDSSPFT